MSERDGRDHTAPKGLLATVLTTGFRFTFRGATRESAVGSRPARNSGRRGSGRCPEQRMPQLMPANGGYCAHQRYRVWHECLEPGRLPRLGAQGHLTPHGKCGYPLEHWADGRRDSSVVVGVVFGGLVKLAETGASVGSPEEDPRSDGRADGPHGARDGRAAARVQISLGFLWGYGAQPGSRLGLPFQPDRQSPAQRLSRTQPSEILTEFRAIVAAM